MAISGAWKAGQAQSGSLKWGTGWNPIHAIADQDPAIKQTPKLTFDGAITVPGDVGIIEDTYGWTEEDANYPGIQTYGYSVQSGTADRPSWGSEELDKRSATAERFPPWGPETGGDLPGGADIRSLDHGSDVTNSYKQHPSEPVTEDWLNKEHGTPGVAEEADPSQVFMQTSMTQRDKTRSGSQISGTASDQDADIHSRVVGQKVKVLPGGDRHYDMRPFDQDLIIRPFLFRQAGTGDRNWMLPNEMYTQTPLQRAPIPDPYQGQEVPLGGPDDFGYADGDYYA
jgi:hypothetical protein